MNGFGPQVTSSVVFHFHSLSHSLESSLPFFCCLWLYFNRLNSSPRILLPIKEIEEGWAEKRSLLIEDHSIPSKLTLSLSLVVKQAHQAQQPHQVQQTTAFNHNKKLKHQGINIHRLRDKERRETYTWTKFSPHRIHFPLVLFFKRKSQENC